MENLEQIYINQLSQILRQFQPKMSDIMELGSIIYRLNMMQEKENQIWGYGIQLNKYRQINLRLARKRLGEIT